MGSSEQPPLFSIGDVSNMTGVNSVTLRAWERRYGLVNPGRTAKGHRVYTVDDVSLIEGVVNDLQKGISISKAAYNLKLEKSLAPDSQSNIWLEYRERIIDAVARFDECLLAAAYNEPMSLYPVDVVTRNLIEPVFQELGARWLFARGRSNEAPVAEEHFFSVFIRNKLGARLHHRNIQNSGPKLIAACLPGDTHEFGLLFFALAAHARGYRIVMLGADMPISELATVASRTDADAVVLSGAANRSCSEFSHELKTLCGALKVPVFIGGSVSVQGADVLETSGARPIGDDLAISLATLGEYLLKHKI